MLVKLFHDSDCQIRIPPLPTSVVPIKSVKFKHNYLRGRSAKLEQFPVTLAYAITDYSMCHVNGIMIESMPKQCATVIAPNGGWRKYCRWDEEILLYSIWKSEIIAIGKGFVEISLNLLPVIFRHDSVHAAHIVQVSRENL